MQPTLSQGIFLFAAALLAGTIDAIAGGGGLITVPAILFTGLPTHFALGTNKGQSVFGSIAALIRYARAGMIHRDRALPAFFLGFGGACLGAALALWIPPEKLKPIVVVMLLCVAVYLTFRGNGPPATDKPVVQRPAVAALAAFCIGAYDGFIGPGTGTFLIIAFVALLGDSLANASANAKVVNVGSNLAALMLFAYKGKVVWAFAVPMVVAQICGGWIGAHIAVRVGNQLVRRVVLVVSIALILKVSYDVAHS